MSTPTKREGVPGLLSVGAVVVLSGPAARAAAEALLIAIRSRRVNGAPSSHVYAELARVLVAAAGHADVRVEANAEAVDMQLNPPTVTVDDAAQRLGLSMRQARRLAPNLGGRLISGRWLLDDRAITEHIEGRSHNG